MADIIPTVLDGIQHIETCWAMPPSLPYAVYHDRTTRRGADLYNGITEHNITIELYAQMPAEDLEALIERRLDAVMWGLLIIIIGGFVAARYVV